MSLHTHVLATQSAHTHDPGLHGDCFSAHVNLPPASVSVFVPCVTNPLHNYLFITTWLFSFSTQRSLSTINEHNKYQNPTTRSKCREQTVPGLCFSWEPVFVFLRIAEDMIHMFTIDAHHHHSPSWRFTLLTRRESCLLSAKMAI